MNDVKHHIDPNQREDLRRVYLAIHGSAIVTDIPEVAAQLKLKRQYVKELFEVLKTHGDRDGDAFVVLNTRAGDLSNDTPHDWYQTGKTVDQHDADMAQHWFDEHFPVSATSQEAAQPKTTQRPKAPANASNPAGLPECRCGCGEAVSNRTRNYKPGHDARHAGKVARYIADGNNDSAREAALAMLPTDALRTKASAMADRLIAKKGNATKPAAKAAKAAAPVVKATMEPGKVRIGRWEYGAERNSVSGAVVYMKKTGQAEVATDKIAATFQAEEA